jgi:type II secretory pathway component PulF
MTEPQDNPRLDDKAHQETPTGRYRIEEMATFSPRARMVARTCAVGILLPLAVLLGGQFLFLYYGWILFMFFHYRNLRQNELVYLLAGAAAAQQPLQASLWAYLLDRPRGAWRGFMEAVLLCAVFPGYWFYHRLHNFDHKVSRLLDLLDSGVPLSQALKQIKGVASRETVLAASVGETTGNLAQTLKKVPQWRVAAIWLDLMPRFVYPLALLGVSFGVVAYLMIHIIPRFEKIYPDFGIKLPVATRLFIDLSRGVAYYWALFLLMELVLAGLVLLLIFNATACWYCPVLGRFYRMIVQSRLLKMLGLLLQTGQPVPQALRVLIDSGYFRGVVRRRLETVCAHVEQGADLAQELCAGGLMPAAMMPLVQSAAKLNNLPWALEELGEHRAKRAVAAALRFTMILFPVTILLSALVVGFVVYSLFVPLIGIMDGVMEWDVPRRTR